MSGGRDLMTLNPAGPRACKTALRNNDLYDRKFEQAGGTNSLLDRHETPSFEDGTMASQRYKGHSFLATSPQTSLMMVAELGSPRMEDSLPGHWPPQLAARKSCETIVEFKKNHSQRKPCQLEAQGSTKKVDAAVLSCIFRARMCLCARAG